MQLLHHTLQGSSCFFGLHFSVGRNAAPSPDPSFASRMQQPCGGFSSSAVPRFNMLAGSSARSIHGAKIVRSYVTVPALYNVSRSLARAREARNGGFSSSAVQSYVTVPALYSVSRSVARARETRRYGRQGVIAFLGPLASPGPAQPRRHEWCPSFAGKTCASVKLLQLRLDPASLGE